MEKYYDHSPNKKHLITEKDLAPEFHSGFCPTTADYLFCFPTTPINSTLYFQCPFNESIVFDNKVYASRVCLTNGTWSDSRYDMCHVAIIDWLKKQREYENNEAWLYRLMADLYFVGFTVTIFSVLLAIFIFLGFRSLRCLRNMIHCNMLATFVLKCSAYISVYLFVKSRNDLVSSQDVN